MPPSSFAKPHRLSRAEQRAETREEILDAAEFLFSKRGLYGVTMRDVAEAVGVHTTLVHYYFDDKRTLFDAVFARRAAITVKLRLEAMDRYEVEAGETPTLEGALGAFLDTDLDLYINGGEGSNNYAALVAQVSNMPELGAELMHFHFDPVVHKLIGLLKKAAPDYAEEDLYWGYHFVSGALMLTLARTGRLDKLSDGLCKSDDLKAIKARMAKFMAMGFRSFVEDRKAG